MDSLFVDLETRSFVDVTEVDTFNYFNHPATEIICVSIARNGGKPGTYAPEDAKHFLDNYRNESINLYAHNVTFEIEGFKMACKKYRWPQLKRARWVCTAAIAASNGLPSGLEKCARAIGLETLKESEGRALMLKHMKPGRDGVFHEIDPNEWDKIAEYCNRDVEITQQIARHLTIQKTEFQLWQGDIEDGKTGVRVDRFLIEGLSAYAAWLQARLHKYIFKKYGVEKLKSTQQVHGALAESGVELPDLQASTIDEALKLNNLPANVIEILKARAAINKSSVKKLHAMLARSDIDGVVRHPTTFCAQHTGRWGSYGIQMHNLPRSSIDVEKIEDLSVKLAACDYASIIEDYGQSLDFVANCIRRAIIAQPGQYLTGGDLAQIELRVLFWIAGEHIGLEKLRKGFDLYVDLASRIFNVRYEDIKPEQRLIGKIGVLSLGYGSGAAKFAGMVFQQSGRRISDDLARLTVKTYRETYGTVCQLWRTLEAAFRQSWKQKCDVKISDSRIYIRSLSPRHVEIILPSRRSVHYRGLYERNETLPDGRTVSRLYFRKQGFYPDSTWGGKLVENVIQAIARDVIAESVHRCRKEKGWTVAFTWHDEIIANTPEPEADKLKQIMEMKADWFQSLPIKAETWAGKRYAK